jgi:hypothetical protein
VLPSDSRPLRPERRARRRTILVDLERLEMRDLMAFSSLGYSLPDLTVSGVSPSPRAAWGGTIGVSAFVDNIGTSTITNPIAQAPGDVTTADAAPSTVAVLITPRPNSLRGAVEIGTIAAPQVNQNSVVLVSRTFTLPSRPAGLGAHNRFYVRLVANATGSVVEANAENNISEAKPVSLVSAALPELRATSLGVPSTMSPGDTITPTISIANLGTAPSGEPVQVALVASTTKSFTVGSSIVALYDITTSIPAESSAADYVYTFTGPAVTLPTSPSTYYLGVVVDPYGKITQLRYPKNVFEQIHVVGPSTSGLSSAGTISKPNDNPFPEPPSGTFIGIGS